MTRTFRVCRNCQADMPGPSLKCLKCGHRGVHHPVVIERDGVYLKMGSSGQIITVPRGKK